ncbi:MAG: FAD-dependent thymidylate synthase [bacterium]|nr:FAD-dependent thymidylate synthase [bacterium]
MYVELIRFTPNPEQTVALAARLCYSTIDISELVDKEEKDAAQFIERLMNSGHHSPFEHANFTFALEGISRACTHQLVRHRIASYSQQSQRYVRKYNFPYTTPPTISKKQSAKELFQKTMKELSKVYEDLIAEGIPTEDARYVLPNACETKIVVTMNARELLHFFRLRCCNRAQWEIRLLADKMLEKVKEVSPNIFRKAGPPCVTSVCPEGPLSCGKPRKGELRS